MTKFLMDEDNLNQILEVKEMLETMVALTGSSANNDTLQINANSLASTLNVLHEKLNNVQYEQLQQSIA